MLFVEVKLLAGGLWGFVDEALKLWSVIDVVPDARDCLQPIFHFNLGGFQYR